MDDDWGYPYFRKPAFARASSAIGDNVVHFLADVRNSSAKMFTKAIYIGNVLTMFLGLGMACGGLTFGSNGFFGIPKFRKLPCCMTMATMATYGNHKPPKDVWFDAVTAN